MLKKFAALFLIFSFSHVYATPGSAINDLNAAMDNINYNLTVVWDQQDPNYKKEQMDLFQAEIENLQALGVSNQELLQNTVGKIKNKRVAEEVNRLFNVVSQDQMTNEETREFIMTHMQESYERGANWTGGGSRGFPVVLILIIATVIYCAHRNMNDDDDDHHRPRRDCYPMGYDFVSAKSFTGGYNNCYPL